MSRLTVVVTGATGNVGSRLLPRLLQDGHRVRGLCRRPPVVGAGGEEPEWVSVDLAESDAEPRLRRALEGADAVVHLAWGFQPSHRLDHLEALGVGGTRRVAEAAVAVGVPHLVHMSSIGAYSPRTGPHPVSESWPTTGVPTSPYSRHKAEAERLLDEVAGRHGELVVTRLRPGIIGQGAAGSALLRYGVPGYVPARLLAHLPVFPLDPRLEVPVVHVTDVVDAVSRVLERTPGGAFNLATDRPVTAEMAALAVTARLLPVPARVLRGTLAAAWHARLAQLDPGWLDLAYSVPLLATDRAEAELGWSARISSVDLLAEVVEGLIHRQSAPTPVLRRRSLADTVRHLATDGPVHRRREP